MLEAGTGVSLREPERLDPAIEEARRAFDQVYPGASQLFDKLPILAKLLGALEAQRIDPEQLFSQLPSVMESAGHTWQQHARTALTSIYGQIAKDFGVDRLTPRQQSAVGREFMAWLSEDQTGARVDRYSQSDPELLGEFLTEYRSGFIDPLRRTADAGTMSRAGAVGRLPAAPRPGAAPAPAPAAKLTPDQVHDNAWQTFRQMSGR